MVNEPTATVARRAGSGPDAAGTRRTCVRRGGRASGEAASWIAAAGAAREGRMPAATRSRRGRPSRTVPGSVRRHRSVGSRCGAWRPWRGRRARGWATDGTMRARWSTWRVHVLRLGSLVDRPGRARADPRERGVVLPGTGTYAPTDNVVKSALTLASSSAFAWKFPDQRAADGRGFTSCGSGRRNLQIDLEPVAWPAIPRGRLRSSPQNRCDGAPPTRTLADGATGPAGREPHDGGS